MKKVKYTQPRVTTHGSIAVGDVGIVSEAAAEKLEIRGQAVILEDAPEPKKAPEPRKAEKPAKAAEPVKPAE